MNKSFTIFSNVGILVILLFILFIRSMTAQSTLKGRQRLLMDYNWKFQIGDTKDANKFSFDDSKWRTLNFLMIGALKELLAKMHQPEETAAFFLQELVGTGNI
jgi:hypothetical protein